jgi:replicative DNA helicase
MIKTEGSENYEEEELKILAGFLQDRFLISTAIEKGFKPFLLRSKLARIVCNVIFEFFDSKQEDTIIDYESIKNELIPRNFFTIEMQKFYTQLKDIEPPQLSQVMTYIEILKMRAGKNKLREVQEKINEYLTSTSVEKKDVADFAGQLGHQLISLQKMQFHEVILPMKYNLYELESEIRNRKDDEIEETMGYSIKPFSTLNKVLSGLRKGFYYGLAGAPRRGKTNFSLALATHIAAQNKIPILYYSWEQTQRVLTLRILSKESLINPAVLQTQNIMQNKLIKNKFIKGWHAAESYMNYIFLVEGGQKENFERIESHAYNVMHEFEVDDIVIFVDYLQKMPLESHITDPQTRINRISSGLSELSLSLHCPIWAISSLDREGCKLDEKESYERPTIHNTMGSGDIEYDLDVGMILLLQQLAELAKSKKIPEDKIPKIEVLNLYIDKNRDAPPGLSNIIQYLFFIDINKHIEIGFKNLEETHTYAKMQNIIKKLIKSRILWAEFSHLLQEYNMMKIDGFE